MIAWIVVFPIASFALAALAPHRAVRITARLIFAAVEVIATFAASQKLDELSALFAILVSVLVASIVLFSSGIYPLPVSANRPPWSRPPAFFLLIGAFWSAMLLAVTAESFIGLWAGMTATTLATTFLVAHLGGRTALEAAWKYLMLCSFGIAIALLGAFMLGRAASDAGIPLTAAFSWRVLSLHGAVLETALARTGLLLMLVGFATKAGLVPMHAWLPDAHAKAPAPVSALLSGLLVSCAFYAIMRVQHVALQTTALQLFNESLRVAGALSLLLGASQMLAQRDLKRMFSYSTIEHAGLIALALGVGTPLALFVALYHVLNHAFGKSFAFLSTGLLYSEQGTTSMGHLRGLRNGASGRALLGSLVGLGGLPPSGLFISEFLLVLALASVGYWLLVGVVLVGMLLGFAALLRFGIESAAGESSHFVQSVKHSAIRWFSTVSVIIVGSIVVALALLPFSPLGLRLFDLARSLTVAG